MSLQPLYCVAEDRHRAVLLTGCLSDMGNPVQQLEQLSDEPSGLEQPALVMWTRRSAATPWLRGLFERDPDTIALVVDEVPPPAACQRAVALHDWPARSADASIGALVRWLANPDTARSPFSSTRSRSAAPDNSNRMAFSVIGACLLLLVGAVLSSQPSDSGAQDAELQPVSVNAADPRTDQLRQPLAASAPVGAQRELEPESARVGDVSGVEGSFSPSAAGAAEGSFSPSAAGAAEGSFSRSAAGAAEGSFSPSAAGAAEGSSSPTGAMTGRGGQKSVAGEDSLSHFCRAQTPEAALAWYRVLSPALKQVLLQIDCVQALLARPEFAGLEAEFQA